MIFIIAWAVGWMLIKYNCAIGWNLSAIHVTCFLL